MHIMLYRVVLQQEGYGSKDGAEHIKTKVKIFAVGVER